MGCPRYLKLRRATLVTSQRIRSRLAASTTVACAKQFRVMGTVAVLLVCGVIFLYCMHALDLVQDSIKSFLPRYIEIKKPDAN